MKLLRILFVSVSCLSLVLPVTAQMMTPAQMREHRSNSFKTHFALGERNFSRGQYKAAAEALNLAQGYATTQEEEFNVYAALAETYKKLGDAAVKSGESPDNIYYRSARQSATSALDLNPSHGPLRALLAEIPSFNNRRERAAAKSQWQQEDDARRQVERKRVEEQRARSGNGSNDVVALAGAALMIYLGGKAIGAAGNYFLGGMATGASGDTKYQCRVQCLRPNRSVFIPVMAGSRAEAASIVTKQAHNVCEYQGSGSATYITLEPEKCEMR